MSNQRGLIAIVAGIVVLLVASVVIILLAGDRPPRQYPAASPEAALQAYLADWEARDTQGTYAALSQSVRDTTPYEEYRAMANDYLRWADQPDGPSRRLFIDRTTVNGDRADLDLTIEETWISGLSSSRNRYSLSLPMVREDGAWRIDELLMGLEYFPKMG